MIKYLPVFSWRFMSLHDTMSLISEAENKYQKQ